MDIKKVLITGSTGYCGHFLTAHFAKQGIPVIGMDLFEHPVIKKMPHFTFIKADIRDRTQLEAIMKEHKPSHVIHLAYLMDPHHDKEFEYDVDVNGSKHIFDLSNEIESVKQFILMSSASAYGAFPDNPEYIDENQELRPRDYNYGIYKKEVEEYYHKCDKRKDMKLVIFRMCTAVGPSYYKPGGVVSSVFKAPFMISIKPGDGRVQFMHEDDVINLFELVMKDGEVEDTFNLAPDDYSSTQELGEELKKKFITLPLWLLRSAFWLLWNLRIATLTPAIARLMAFGIIVSPKKLLHKYDYRLKYGTKAAFMDAVEKRKAANNL